MDATARKTKRKFVRIEVCVVVTRRPAHYKVPARLHLWCRPSLLASPGCRHNGGGKLPDAGADDPDAD